MRSPWGGHDQCEFHRQPDPGQLRAGELRLETGSFLQGTVPANYNIEINTGAKQLDLTHEATVNFAAAAGYNGINVHVGTNTIGVTVSDTALANSDSATYTLSAPGVTGLPGGTATAQGAANTSTGTYSALAGINTKTVTITNTGNTWTNTPASVTITQTGYNLASTNFNTTSVNLGTIHSGASFTASSLSIDNSLGAGTYNETLGAQFASASGVTTSGVPITVAAGAAANTNMTVNLSSAPNGQDSGRVDVTFNSQAVNNSGLGTTPLPSLTQTVTVSGNVFNGTGVWQNSDGGTVSWGSGASSNWMDSGGVQAAPGTFAGYNDTATFDGTGTTPLVNLGDISPSLAVLNFSGATNYTIEATGSGKLTLNGGGSCANVNVTSGSHTISAPVQLNDSATVTTNGAASLTVSGAISDDGGTRSLTKAGDGTLTLSNATNSYGGATNVNAGTLIVSGGISGSGAVNVNGGNLEADGLITGAVTVNSGELLGNGGTVGGITANGGTVAPGLKVGSAATGTLTANGPVNLNDGSSFNIRVGVLGKSGAPGSLVTDNDQLKVTGDANTVTLTGKVTLNISVGAGVVNGSTPGQFLGYVYEILNGGYSSGTFSSLYINGVLANNSGGNVYTTGSYTVEIMYGYDGGTFVAGTGDGTDVAVQLDSVPEPGTWGMLLGGLAMLMAIQRRRRNI